MPKKIIQLIPTIIQDATTGQVLMLGYSNAKSLVNTKATGRVWFYSRSKERLWEKGETSGNYLKVVQVSEDCDQDAILIQVRPSGPTCHTGQVACFGSASQGYLYILAELIMTRQQQLPAGSYTTSLFQAGTGKIVAKVSEEAAEVVNAALTETPQRLTEEAADLIYHLLVLLTQQGVTLKEVTAELEQRWRQIKKPVTLVLSVRLYSFIFLNQSATIYLCQLNNLTTKFKSWLSAISE